MAAWATPAGADLQRESRGLRGLASAGLAGTGTRLPDESVLAARIRAESLMLIGTRGDTPADHARAGRVVERTWLEATSAGLAGSLLTQPLHLQEVQSGLAEELATPLIPQVLVRLGYPE